MRYKLVLLLILFWSQLATSQSDTCLNYLELGLSFPPVGDVTERTFTQTHMNVLGVDRIRFGEHWALREPSPGVFSWSGLEQRIDWAYTNNIDVLLTIQSDGPAWACSGVQNPRSCVFNNNQDFKFYIDSLLQRYSGKIDKIQFGNEWQDHFWYAGNAQDFIDANNILYNSVQQYSPTTSVVLPQCL